MPLQVELVSPERILFSGEAEMVTARTTGGDIAFLTGHAPFLGILGIGAVTVKRLDGSESVAAVHGGFVEVSDNHVIILSDVAELADQIDVARAEARLAKLERASGGDDEAEAAAALRRQQVRLEVAARS
ncbi:MAG TPA: F0F1 ATP synthase subunit epsilon [Acidimicrobiales bacterium]|nr:F0F1 ATP synthase subunit epsilon [Acidimicrobiales bacterium]